MLIKRIRRQSDAKIPVCNPVGGKLLLRPSTSYNKLLGRVVLRILSDIQDGALLQKYTRAIRCWLFLQTAQPQMFEIYIKKTMGNRKFYGGALIWRGYFLGIRKILFQCEKKMELSPKEEAVK